MYVNTILALDSNSLMLLLQLGSGILSSIQFNFGNLHKEVDLKTSAFL